MQVRGRGAHFSSAVLDPPLRSQLLAATPEASVLVLFQEDLPRLLEPILEAASNYPEHTGQLDFDRYGVVENADNT